MPADRAPTDVPDLATYAVALCSISAGKDSAAALYELVRHADAAGVRDRVRAVHADLGDVDWPHTLELAARHTARHDVPLTVVSRRQDDLLGMVEQRGMWPSSKARYCTSALKRTPVRTLMTKLVARERQRGVRDPVRVLHVMGIRAEESRSLARRPAFSHDSGASNGRRHVDEWLPVHDWSLEDFRELHEREQLELHYAYRLGMTRASCALCVLAGRDDLIRAAAHRPDLAARYEQVERTVEHRFRDDVSMADIIALAADPARVGRPSAQQIAHWRCPTWPPDAAPAAA
jgi:3'-phosphoadenosine 5'-phosphosulfate sulfotransferase (PAPS reductase)/FAD synthetase